jgi:hypothetical protein
MGFGRTASRRRQAARKHAAWIHTCKCGRVIRGNGYYKHRIACSLRNRLQEAASVTKPASF